MRYAAIAIAIVVASLITSRKFVQAKPAASEKQCAQWREQMSKGEALSDNDFRVFGLRQYVHQGS